MYTDINPSAIRALGPRITQRNANGGTEHREGLLIPSLPIGVIRGERLWSFVTKLRPDVERSPDVNGASAAAGRQRSPRLRRPGALPRPPDATRSAYSSWCA